MSDNDLSVGIGFEVDNASVAQAKAAAASVGDAYTKTANDLKRIDLDSIAKDYADIAKAGGSVGSSLRLAVAEAQKFGATDDEIRDLNKLFNQYRETIDEAVESTKELDAAQRQVASNPPPRGGSNGGDDRIDATNRESGNIGDIGDALGQLGFGDLGSIFEGIEAIARLKVTLEVLPQSLIATAQAAGILGQSQAAAAAADIASANASGAAAAAETAQATASGGLAAASGAASVGIGSMMLALGPIAAVLAGITIAAKLMADSLVGANADLKAAYDAQREVQEFVRSGATSGDAKARLDEIQRVLDDERENLANAKADYAEAFNAAANSIPIIGDLFARIADLFGAFGATKGEVDEATKAVKENEKEQGALNKALEENKFAASDAAKAQEEASKATTSNAAATTKATQQQSNATASGYQSQEQMLAQHLANEGSLKGQAYNQQIQMVQQAAASVQNGYRPLNMSGASNSFKAGSFVGLRPIPTTTNNTVGPRIGTLQINTSANPQDVIKVLNDLDMLG